MVTANGKYLTKHSAGLYSTDADEGPWRREDPKKLQAEVDAATKERVNTTPDGTGTIETYCVAYGKDAPGKGYVLGRLDGSGDRFVAMAPQRPGPAGRHADAASSSAAAWLPVTETDGRNVFHPIDMTSGSAKRRGRSRPRRPERTLAAAVSLHAGAGRQHGVAWHSWLARRCSRPACGVRRYGLLPRRASADGHWPWPTWPRLAMVVLVAGRPAARSVFGIVPAGSSSGLGQCRALAAAGPMNRSDMRCSWHPACCQAVPIRAAGRERPCGRLCSSTTPKLPESQDRSQKSLAGQKVVAPFGGSTTYDARATATEDAPSVSKR